MYKLLTIEIIDQLTETVQNNKSKIKALAQILELASLKKDIQAIQENDSRDFLKARINKLSAMMMTSNSKIIDARFDVLVNVYESVELNCPIY